MDKIADELLKEILSPPLRVPDDMFANTDPFSPFSKAMFSAADVLLVCKRWMRVGTPALYETVIIRSSAQAQALQMALASNPYFGRFVKKLRLEGAYGAFITPNMIECMGRVTDFCFTLSVFSADKLGGLAKALKTFNPKRLVLALHDPDRDGNSQYSALVRKLCKAMTKWTKLEHFCFATPYGRHSSQYRIVPTLTECKSLRTVELWPDWYRGGDSSSKDRLLLLLASQSIQTIILHSSTSIPSPSTNYLVASLAPDMLQRLRFAGPESISPIPLDQSTASNSTLALAGNPFYTPMQPAARNTRLRIWGRILAFAVLKDTDTSRRSSNTYWSSRRHPWFEAELVDTAIARSCLTISRDIHDTLVPILFRHLSINSWSNFAACTTILNSHSPAELGACVQSLAFGIRDGTNNPSSTSPDSNRLIAFFAVLSNVRQAHINLFGPGLGNSLPALGQSSSRTLQSLTLSSFDKWSESLSLNILNHFTALEELHINAEHARFTASSTTEMLPNLQVLYVHRASGSFFTALSKASLPKLSRLDIRMGLRKADGFIKKHGKKIKTLLAPVGLDKAHMEDMTTLTSLRLREEVSSVVLLHLQHPHLHQLQLDWETARVRGLQNYRAAAAHLSTSRFPALTEVVVARRSEIWPGTERDIKKSPWPEISAAFAAKGVTVVDYTGRPWRPRLQLQ